MDAHTRAMIYVLHSHDPRFAIHGFKPLSLERILWGELTVEETHFYRLVIQDFCNNSEYEGTRRPPGWEPLPTAGFSNVP